MIVLGLDPGYARCGYGVVEIFGDKIVYKAHGCFETKANMDFSDRLVCLGHELSLIIDLYKPDLFALEKIFFTKNVKTAIDVAQARGVVLYIAKKSGIRIAEMTPTQIKSGLVGYGGADKIQMQKMVQAQLGLSEIPKPDDAADALAVAICIGVCNRTICI